MRLPVERGHLPRPGSGSWLASRSDGHRLHAGVDLVVPVGTAVLAPEAGVVKVVVEAARPTEPRRSSPPGWSGYGPRAVVIQGADGVYHLLAHMGTVDVRVGQAVSEGASIGTVGVTSTPHLHWETRSRLQPIGRAAVVEICADPGSWLNGEWRAWDGQCPTSPVDDVRTPRCCRPGWVGPAPDPFPRPVLRPRPRTDVDARPVRRNPRGV